MEVEVVCDRLSISINMCIYVELYEVIVSKPSIIQIYSNCSLSLSSDYLNVVCHRQLSSSRCLYCNSGHVITFWILCSHHSKKESNKKSLHSIFELCRCF